VRASPPQSATADGLFDKRRPAKVIPHGAAIHRTALRLVNHVQVLVYTRPPAVTLLEQWAHRFRTARDPIVYLACPQEDRSRMNSHESDDDARASALRLVELIQVLAPERPVVVQAVERCVRALVVDEARQRIMGRLRQFSPEDIAAVDALTAQLERNRTDPESAG
jgi:hypothetical protein